MSGYPGVGNFVHRRGTPPPGQPPQYDRKAIAAKAKLPTKKAKSNPPVNHQHLSSTAPAPGYSSNSTAARNTFPEPRYSHQAPPHNEPTPAMNMGISDEYLDDDRDTYIPESAGLPFDETVTEGFDHTRSDVGHVEQGTPHLGRSIDPLTDDDDRYSEEDDPSFDEGAYREHGYKSPDLPAHKLHHQAGRSPIVNNEAELRNHRMSRGIIGRFSPHLGGQNDMQHGNMQIRYSQNGQAEPQHRNDSKKRSRGHNEEAHGEGHNQEHGYEQHEYPSHNGNDVEQLQDGSGKLEATSTHVSPSGSLHDRQRQQGPDNADGSKAPFNPRAHGPDYSEEKLKGIKYQQLKEQTWESEDATTNRDSSVQHTGPLDIRFQNIVELEGNQAAQLDFFSRLSIQEWEEAGDLFIAKFGELMKKMVEQRKARRAMISKYESKIEKYEGIVRGKSQNLDQKLKDMKKGGEGVLRGKMT